MLLLNMEGGLPGWKIESWKKNLVHSNDDGGVERNLLQYKGLIFKTIYIHWA